MRIAELKPKKLILGARTVEKAERVKCDILAKVPSLDDAAIQVVPVEYTSFSSVSQFAATIRQTTQTLDCLLLSAGVALPTRETTEDGWPTTFKINVLAPTLLAIELLPLLSATPGSVLEFVNSISYCNVTSQDVAPLLDDPAMSTLAYFNGPERWTTQRAYYEAKLMLMFVLDGLVETIGGDRGTLRGNPTAGPIVLACCPGQCKASLYRSSRQG
ncbi:NAD(P)-binding protein [Apiospora kogelbergensis]|uniref:NAD(P)-binding protein n=1 Tax=Apiospora kogelbergensis TaxID=1337665 RepID=UPI00312F262E